MPAVDPLKNEGYYTGGVASFESDQGINGLSDFIGRFRNNLNGTTANNIYNSLEAEKARLFNSAEAQKDRDFQTYMSNTAYQRAVADMKAAGINPASLSGDAVGSPASTPQGSRANSAPAASATNGLGRSGIFDLAKAAISMALFKKFGGTAAKAVTAKEVVKDVGEQALSARIASKELDRRIWQTFEDSDTKYARSVLRGSKLFT